MLHMKSIQRTRSNSVCNMQSKLRPCCAFVIPFPSVFMVHFSLLYYSGTCHVKLKNSNINLFETSVWRLLSGVHTFNFSSQVPVQTMCDEIAIELSRNTSFITLLVCFIRQVSNLHILLSRLSDDSIICKTEKGISHIQQLPT